jgi:Domain of unknown function (DUF5666)
MRNKLLRQSAGLGVLIALALLIAAAQNPPTRAAASLEPTTPAQMRFEGELKSKTPKMWTIGEYDVLVDQQTNVIEKRGPAQVGAWLIVWATNEPNDKLRAELIYVDRPVGQPSPTVQFTDTLTKMTNEWWVVGGNLVHISPATLIVGTPSLDCLVSVTAEEQDSVLEANRLEVIAQTPTDVSVEFEGNVEGITSDLWQVQGQEFRVTSETKIPERPTMGEYVEVEATRASDGLLTAILISIPDHAAERTMGAIIGNISPDEGDAELWDVTVVSVPSGGDPYSAFVHVDGNTIMDESQAVAEVGQWADMRTRALGSGEFAAEVIRIEQPISVTVEADLQTIGSVAGNRSASDAGIWWQVNGRTIWIPGGTLTAVAAAGEQGKVRIEGVLLGNGVVWAKRLVSP